MKDNFSARSADYAQFRPAYPPQLFDFLFEHCQNFDRAWDCATGNGQVATVLAERFAQVEATDISENQLKNALLKPNIRYRLGRAEATDFSDHSFDLVTVGQAAHWFDFEKFYPEVRRVLKPGGFLALVGYTLVRIDEPVDAVINHLYDHVLDGYWDPERRLVDEALASIPFPFAEMPFPEMDMKYEWTLDAMLGFIGTWSGVQHFIRRNGHSPLDEGLVARLKEVWPEGEVKTARFPIFGRVARV